MPPENLRTPIAPKMRFPRSGLVLRFRESGDVWRLGPHVLACGDARDPATYRAVLGISAAEMAVTDPPYNVKIDGHVSGLGVNKAG